MRRGFTVVEVLLAATIFGMLVAALGGALIYGRASTASSGDRNRASALADEGIEAARGIRDAAYGNLVDGTFGLVQSSNQWILSGSSDVSGAFTRQVTIASNGTTRKNITSTVSWTDGGATKQVSAKSQLTNWLAAIVSQLSWASPVQKGVFDVPSSTNDGIKVATQGNYAYLVRNGGVNLLIIDISNPASPNLVGSLTLAGVPTNIAVSGNYAYVTNTSNTAEMQIIEVTNPSAPVLRSSYNASGTGDGAAVFVSGNYAYLARKANGGTDEFVTLNVVSPFAPARVGWYGLNVNMNDIYVNGTTAYIATSSGTQEVLKLTNLQTGLVTTVAAVNLPGTTTPATTISGFSSTLLVGQGTAFHTVNGTANTITGTLTLSGVVNDIAFNTANTYAFVATAAPAAEFQVISISTLATPTFVQSVNTTSDINGVAYNSTLDLVPAAGAADTQELVIFGPS